MGKFPTVPELVGQPGLDPGPLSGSGNFRAGRLRSGHHPAHSLCRNPASTPSRCSIAANCSNRPGLVASTRTSRHPALGTTAVKVQTSLRPVGGRGLGLDLVEWHHDRIGVHLPSGCRGGRAGAALLPVRGGAVRDGANPEDARNDVPWGSGEVMGRGSEGAGRHPRRTDVDGRADQPSTHSGGSGDRPQFATPSSQSGDRGKGCDEVPPAGFVPRSNCSRRSNSRVRRGFASVRVRSGRRGVPAAPAGPRSARPAPPNSPWLFPLRFAPAGVPSHTRYHNGGSLK